MKAAVSHSRKANPELVSVIIPVYNEEKNIGPLLSRLTDVLSKVGYPYEVIVIDDGSKDNSFGIASSFAKKDSHIRLIRFKTNFGQTAALSAGIEHARGSIIVSIDGDLENSPEDIPKLINKIDEGYDVVSGWREGRWRGSFLSRRLPSLTANWLISYFTNVRLHDYGCTLKAYRAEAIRGIRLYGEMHRFIPAYAAWQGAHVTEIPVTYKPRTNGESKYGFGRVYRVLLDLIVVVFMYRYMNRPMHFFGAWGLASFVLGVLSGLAALLLRLFNIRHIVDTPLPILATLLIIVGIQLMLFGVIAEILMRTYYESQSKRPYTIRENSSDL